MSSFDELVVIAFCGAKGSGKSTTAQMIRSVLPEDSVKILGFSEAIYDMVHHLPYLSPDTPKDRKIPELGNRTKRDFLIEVGQNCRKLFSEIWIESLRHRIVDAVDAGYKFVIIDDMRQPNEYQFLREEMEAIIIRTTHEPEELRESTIDHQGTESYWATFPAIEADLYTVIGQEKEEAKRSTLLFLLEEYRRLMDHLPALDIS